MSSWFNPKILPLVEVPVPARLCWECQHVRFLEGTPDYSDLTPGNDMELYCIKQYWDFDNGSSLNSLRDCLTTAERCADFEEAPRT